MLAQTWATAFQKIWAFYYNVGLVKFTIMNSLFYAFSSQQFHLPFISDSAGGYIKILSSNFLRQVNNVFII